MQAYEYAHAAFSFGGNIYGSTFFMATGFHGFHVIVGTIFLIVCLIRAIMGDFTPKQHFGFEAAAWYWHFVDVVWLFLFFCIYVWGGWGAPMRGRNRLTYRGQGPLSPAFTGLDRAARPLPALRPGAAVQGLSSSVAPRCEVCGLDFAFADSGDGPAVFIMLIVGFIVVGLALFVEFTFEPPLWVHVVLWVPLVLGPVARAAAPAQGPDDRPAVPPQGGRGPPRRGLSMP